jgi:MFS family permease
MKTFSVFLKEFSHITNGYKLMLLTLFFMRAGQFMLLPFLAIYLSRYSSASPIEIGMTIGIGPLIYGATGINAGILVDRFGAKNTMVGALFISSITLTAFMSVQSVLWCFMMNAITGFTRSLFDISTKSYGIHHLTLDQRRITFSLRFMSVNSAAALGPVLGAYFAVSNSIGLFRIAGFVYFVLAVFSIFYLQRDEQTASQIGGREMLTFAAAKQIFFNDSSLRILVLINFLIFTAFAQIDSTLPQHLHAELANGVSIYALLLVINATLCVLLQLIVSRLIRNIPESVVSFVGVLGFVTAYLFMGLFLNEALLIMAIILLTLAEITLLPLNDLLLAKIAPSDRIGTYYGIAGTAMLGFGIGPMIGGVIYHYCNAQTLFFFCSSLCLITIYLYQKLFRNLAQNIF